MLTMRLSTLAVLALPLAAAFAQTDTVRVAYSPKRCPSCAEWTAPHAPVRIFGNTYYVGTNAISAILITSSDGHVLIDGGVPMAAPLVVENIRRLGFRIEDVKLILNSHDHYDHAGALAELARRSGARVAATAKSATVLRAGESDPSDPQYGIALPYPPVHVDTIVVDGTTLHVGKLAVTAHVTAGHTPGSTTWTWSSCEGSRCLDMVYADSQTPVSADNFFYTRSTTYPTGVSDFEHGQDVISKLRCDILLTPHPDATELWERIDARDRGDSSRLIDSGACARYAATGRERLKQRVERERAGKGL